MARVSEIRFVGYGVSDLESERAFYRDVWGLREMGEKAEGIMVDLHVVRVAPRLGIASGTDPKKIEKQMMELLEPKIWGEVGMALSFLGRETCRPTNPQHDECVLKDVCAYCNNMK